MRHYYYLGVCKTIMIYKFFFIFFYIVATISDKVFMHLPFNRFESLLLTVDCCDRVKIMTKMAFHRKKSESKNKEEKRKKENESSSQNDGK